MSAKNNGKTMKTLATGFLLSGLALAALATVGCDRLPPEAITVLTSGARVASVAQPDLGYKADARSAPLTNHNETFLIGAGA